MKPVLKRVLLGVASVLVVAALGGGGFACVQTSAYDASLEKVYDVPLTTVTRSTDAVVIARGRHLAEAVAPCSSSHCHGTDLGGAQFPSSMGPLAEFNGPNLTRVGIAATYSDAELFRLLRHGIKRDGRSVRFMTVPAFNWLPDDEIVAVISYVRTVPPVERPNGKNVVGTVGKVMDRQADVAIDIARRIDHAHANDDLAPPPSPTATYGRHLAKLCASCHGPTLSGGHVPGTPPSMAIPLNLTPDATGLAGFSYEEFDRVLTTRIRKNGKPLDEFMPATFGKLDDTEKRAVFAYLQTVPSRPFGQR
jgi:mono/diheme cytochrome c family protein